MTAQAQTRTFHPTISNRALLMAIALAAGVIVAGLVAVAVMNAPAQTGSSTDVVLGPGYTEWRHAQAAALASTIEVPGPGYAEWRRAQAAALAGANEVPGPGYAEWRRSQQAGQ